MLTGSGWPAGTGWSRRGGPGALPRRGRLGRRARSRRAGARSLTSRSGPASAPTAFGGCSSAYAFAVRGAMDEADTPATAVCGYQRCRAGKITLSRGGRPMWYAIAVPSPVRLSACCV